MPDSDEIPQTDRSGKVGVFISYNHADLAKADALRQSLIAISPALDLFIDHAGLHAGDEYERVLAQKVGVEKVGP